MVDRTPKIATLLRQKPAAEGRIQGIGRHPTEADKDNAFKRRVVEVAHSNARRSA